MLPLSLFDFELPPERIAQVPASPRHHSRLMGVGGQGDFAHHRFDDLPKLLNENDLLIVNKTQVIPARLHLQKESGGKVELLVHRPEHGDYAGDSAWWAMGKPGKALRPGRTLFEPGHLAAPALEVIAREGALALVKSVDGTPLLPLLERLGEPPLPPYIRRADADAARAEKDVHDYQTIFAKEKGAVAAPTASLHFTPEVMDALDARGIERMEVLLHVGLGTFLPVREEHAEDVRQHCMHEEWYEVPEATQAKIAQTKAAGGRVIACGTTSARALETWWWGNPDVHSHGAPPRGEPCGHSRLFIYPGYEFGVVDGLITNFHLPKSTLLMLVSALIGRERLMAAYAEAIAQEYRFYSYGDAMLVLPEPTSYTV